MALCKIYKMMTHQDKPIYLYHALLLFSNYDSLDWKSVVVKVTKLPKIKPLKSVDEINDEYVIDQHVRGEKTMASHIKLLKESFYIDLTKLNKQFLHAEYVPIYRDIKIGVGYYKDNKVFPAALQLEYYIKNYFGTGVSAKETEDDHVHASVLYET